MLETAHNTVSLLTDIRYLFERTGFTRPLIFEVKSFPACPVYQLPVVFFDMRLVVVWIGIFLQIGAKDGLRFFKFCHPDCFECVNFSDVSMQAHEIYKIRS